MTKERVMEIFQSFKGSELTFPFDEVTEVYKVGGKMFGLIGKQDGTLRINLKGIPENNYTLRSMFPAIIPGYHMNKEHWNSVLMDGSLEEELIIRLISESYDLVVNSLPKKRRILLLGGEP